MKSVIYNLENMKRMTAFPYPVKEIGLMVNHFANNKNRKLDSIFFCYSFNKKKYNPAESNNVATMGVLLPGTVLNSTKVVYHDELFFTYTPEVSQRLAEMLAPLPVFQNHRFVPDGEFNANLGKVHDLLEKRMILGNADKLDVLALQILFSFLNEPVKESMQGASILMQEAAGMIRKGIPLDQVISECCMSRRSFYYEWKKIFSMTPKQMFLDHKLKEVRRLLLRSSLSVAEIADQCGFSSQTALHDCFVKHCGITPGAFRARWNIAHQQSVKSGAAFSS